MSNRITQYAAMVRAKRASIGDTALDGTSWDDAEKNLDINHFERVAYQNAQARSHAMGKLTTDEAMVVYRAIGEVGSSKNGGWSKGTDYALKVTVTKLMGELLLK